MAASSIPGTGTRSVMIYQELRLGSIILIIGTRTGIILMYDTYVDSLPARGLPAHVQPTTIASCLV